MSPSTLHGVTVKSSDDIHVSVRLRFKKSLREGTLGFKIPVFHIYGMDRSLTRFFAGIRTETTREIYDRYLRYFLNFVKIKEANGLLQLKDSYLQTMVEDYIIHLKGRGLRKSSIDGQISALELFFAMNDKVLNFKKIRKMSPIQLKIQGNGSYTTDDIKRMLESTTSLRNKAIIHCLASLGCRPNAFCDPSLRLRHLREVRDGYYSVLMYEGSIEEYTGYLTKEASNAVKMYLEERQKEGEVITPDSPLFRNLYRVVLSKAKPMTIKGIKSMMSEILKKMRGKGKKRGERYAVAMIGGFRHRYIEICAKNKLDVRLAERLVSHTPKSAPMDKHYVNINNIQDELFGEFLKIEKDLTISSQERERVRREQAEQKVKTLEDEKDKRIKQLEEQQKETAEMVKGLWELLGKKN